MNLTSRIITLALLFAFGLGGVSCNRDKASGKGSANLTPEQAKVHEAYRKGLERSKDKVAAKVNAVNISMFDLINEMNLIGPQYVQPGQERDPKVDEQVRKEALDRLIYRELAVQEAVRQGITAPPEALAERLKKIKADLKTEEAYRDKLKQSSITEEELRKQIERNLLVEMITGKEIFGKVKVDQEQMKKTYAKKKASYKGQSGQQMSFEEARPIIEEELMTPLVHKREDIWAEQLKKAARIEIVLGDSAKEIYSVRQ
jgi:hypothetical protein